MTGTLRIGSVESLSTAVLPDLLVRFHDEHPLVELVLRTAGESRLGVAFLPRFAAAASLASGSLVEVPSEGLGPMDMWTQLFVHRQRLASPPVAAFVELLTAG